MIWVRSQNKEQLVETNNFSIAEIIGINDYGDDLEIIGYTIDCDTQGETYELGKYSTKEKVMKVLDMIQRRIMENKIMDMGTLMPNPTVFQMPQDSEV